MLLLHPVLMPAEPAEILVTPAGSAAPLRFETESSNILRMNGGQMVTGDVYLANPLGRIRLAGARLMFEYAPGTERIERLRGTAFVPSPYESSKVSITQPVMAEVGMDRGANLQLGIPLAANRTYLYFQFNAGFGMQVGATDDPNDTKAFSLSVPVGAEALLVMDPLDPFYYLSGAIATPSNKDDKEGVSNSSGADGQPANDDDAIASRGEGKSSQGLIPFVPQTTYGIADRVRGFSGHKILAGDVQIPKLPIAVSGYKIESVGFGDSDRAAGLFELDYGPWAQIGANGKVKVAYRFLKLARLGKIANFEFDLGTASAAVQFANGVEQAWFSGVLKPDTSWIPDLVPITPEADGHAYGFLSSRPEDFVMHVDTRYALSLSNLSRLSGVNLGNLVEVEGSTTISPDGYRLKGRSAESLGPLAAADRRLEVWIPFDDSDGGYLQAEGMLRVITLQVDGLASASRKGVLIDGKLDTPNLNIQVTARMSSDQSGAFAEGTLSVPPQFQPDFNRAIESAATSARALVEQRLSAYEQATRNYEIELSLRGLRTVIPAVCDTAIREINNGIEAGFDAKWPRLLPGRSLAEADANERAEPSRRRLRALKAAVQRPDGDAARSALKAALQDLLNNPRLTIRLAVVGTVYDREILSSANKNNLRTAISAVDALPDVSERKIRAEQIWNATPKAEVLRAVDEAIRSAGSFVPRIANIGFRQPLFTTPLRVFADVVLAGKTSRVYVNFDPADPAGIGREIGRSYSAELSAGTVAAPPPPNTPVPPVIASSGIVSGAGGQALIAPGTWVAIYGSNLAPATRTWRTEEIVDDILPRQLEGVRVLIGGRAAAVYYVSPTQISVVAPSALPTGTAKVQVINGSGSSDEVTVRVATASPGFFLWQGSGRQYAVATTLEFGYVGPPDLFPGAVTTPATPGDVIILWGSGFGNTTPAFPEQRLVRGTHLLQEVPRIMIGGVEAEYVSGALSPGSAALYQIAVRVPDVEPGDKPVTVSIDGVESGTNVYLRVGQRRGGKLP